MKPKIIEEKPMSMVEVKSELQKIKKRDEELNFRANKTEEYFNSFMTLSAKDGAELKEKLTALDVPRLKEQHIIKIIDTLPTSEDELKMILQGYTITINKENADKIVKSVSEYVKSK
ncbi:hypothetical protein KY334_01610 [Candidatus Woesearchaeota archaeon]|nr:hypothetical protein [Candidatus Woesearchaeota archaeon]